MTTLTPEEEAAAKVAFERDLQRLRGTIAETAPEVAPAPKPPAPPLGQAREAVAEAPTHQEFKTRADLANAPGFVHLQLDSDGAPCVWQNHYFCPNCGHAWSDEWSSQCDDRCPMCNTSATPDSSDWLGPKDGLDAWDVLPEVELPAGSSCFDTEQKFLDAVAQAEREGHGPAPSGSCFIFRGGIIADGEPQRVKVTERVLVDRNTGAMVAPFGFDHDKPPQRHVDPMVEAVWLAQQAVAKAREAGRDMETLFHAVRLHEEEAEMQNELVERCAPRWAWEVIDDALTNGSQDDHSDIEGRDQIGDALTAMITASERGDDVPISREEARRIRETGE